MEPMGRIATCTLFFVAMLGTAVAQQVKTDFDHQANFSRYKTYSWQEVKPANSVGCANQERGGCSTGGQGLDSSRQWRRCVNGGDCDESNGEDVPDFL
jgi:hypothetical protein